MNEAVKLRTELNGLLAEAGMKLRKWRSNSTDVLDTIPEELKESSGLQIVAEPSYGSKTLGIYWDTVSDNMHVSVPSVDSKTNPTKREVASSAAKVFDTLGWFAPAVVWVKVLLQKVWESGVDWDDPIPDNLASSWDNWIRELPHIKDRGIPRRLFHNDKDIMEVQLHGFSDASQSAYGGVIYLRTLYTDTSVSVTLLIAKTRVAPLKKLTIPRLELCGALLTARLLKATAVDLEIPDSNFYIWTDSTIVLAWLKSTPSRLKVYVAHCVQEMIRLIPPEKWKHVSTSSNPADLASRGVLPKELLSKRLWWDGPTWLSSSPEEWPYLQQAPRTLALPEIRNVFRVAVEPMSSELWCRFSSLKRLVRVLSWCNPFHF